MEYDSNIISNETWLENIQLKGRIYKIDKKAKLVFCDCIIFDDNNEKTFEKRQFPLYLFENINPLKEKSFVIISIKRKAGSMRMDIIDGQEIVEKSDFEVQDLWNF